MTQQSKQMLQALTPEQRARSLKAVQALLKLKPEAARKILKDETARREKIKEAENKTAKG